MKKLQLIFGLIILFTIFLSGCNGNSNNMIRFIGEWGGYSLFENTTIDVTFTFYNDKTAKQISDGSHVHWFDFYIDDSFVYLTLTDFPEVGPIIYNYKFSNNYNSLTLTNESIDTIILTKQ